MSTDLMPLSPSANESLAAPAPLQAVGQTLTLQLRVVPGVCAGRIMLRGPCVPALDTVRVRVVMPAQPRLVFTV